MTEDPRRDSPADAAPAAAQAPQTAPQLRIGTVAKLNLADFQNAVPALLELAIVNEGDLPLQALSLHLARSLPSSSRAPGAWSRWPRTAPMR